jgi:hypothetical protein
MSEFEDLWIMERSGLTIFEKVSNVAIDGQLFGGFMSAINTFASQIDEKGLSNIHTGKKLIVFHKTDRLVYIAGFDEKIKPKDAQKVIIQIADKFNKMFPPSFFDHWKGNLAPFEQFGEQLTAESGNAIGKMAQALW